MAEAGVWRVGVVDSGWAPALRARVCAARSFLDDAPATIDIESTVDRLGHGTQVMQAIAALAPQVRFCVAQVFGDQLRTTAAQVASAMDWLVEEGVAVINLSLGVRQDDARLRAACRRALDAGVLLCASTPARGEAVYPAACPGVVRVMGDARCAPGEHSALLLPHADFGACVLPPDADRRNAGASMGCAHLSGRVAALLCEGVARERGAVWHALLETAAHHGREYRRAEP